MDIVIDHIRSLNHIESEWKSLKEKIIENFDIISNLGNQILPTNYEGNLSKTLLQSIIQDLINSDLSIGAAILLAVQSENLPETCELLYLEQSRYFFSNVSKQQVLFLNKEVLMISEKLLNIFNQTHRQKIVIFTLLKASELLSPNPNTLTPIHSYFLQACISTQMYTFAVQILNKTHILQIDPGSTNLTPIDYLSYFYYAGICFSCVKNYSAALAQFQQAVALPGNQISAIAVAALQKARLISLLLHGTSYELPKYCSPIVQSFSKQEMYVYDSVDRLCLADDEPALALFISEPPHAAELSRHHNLGLCRQLLGPHGAMMRHRLNRLTDTYTAVPIKDVVRIAKLADSLRADCQQVSESESLEAAMELLVAHHIAACGPFEPLATARIDQRAGALLLSAVQPPQEELAPLLQSHLHGVQQLADAIRTTHRAIVTSPEYLSAASRQSKG